MRVLGYIGKGTSITARKRRYMLKNDINPNLPADSSPVFYDSFLQKFFCLKDSQMYEINQEELQIFTYEDMDKIKEMLQDWERDKYPERFL